MRPKVALFLGLGLSIPVGWLLAFVALGFSSGLAAALL